MFFYGFLCGVAATLGMMILRQSRRVKRRPPTVPPAAPLTESRRQHDRETRNFLYYDGTEMPADKEETT